MLYEKNIEYFLCMRKRFFLIFSVFSQCEIEFWGYFLAILWNFRIFWKNSGFSYANQLWKIRFLLYEIGPSLFAFVKHLYTYGNDDNI